MKMFIEAVVVRDPPKTAYGEVVFDSAANLERFDISSQQMVPVANFPANMMWLECVDLPC